MSEFPGPQPLTPGPSTRPLVLVVGGVGGLDFCSLGLRRAARLDRLPAAVEVVSWGHGFGRWYRDLSDLAHLDAQAARIARRVAEFRDANPGEPVFLVGKSGGGGLAVRALERMDVDAIERAILLAPALSPRYDLTRALRAVRREMVVFTSPLDLIILGAGTRVFGTIDRVRTAGAGLVGFEVPGDGEAGDRAEAYAKLRQVRWRPSMVGSWHLGGHFGTDSPRFLRRYVLPMLLDDRPGAESGGAGSSRSPGPPIS